MKFPFVPIILFFLPFQTFSAGIIDTLPFTFKAGDTARAAAVNENFKYLLNYVKQATAKVDSLASVTAKLSDSLVKSRIYLQLPIGTIIGSMLSPTKFAEQFPGEAAQWKLADGSPSSQEYFNATENGKVPDLRGRFLRGLNQGIDSTDGDPEGKVRTAGSYQADTIKLHKHYSDSVFNSLVGCDNQFTLTASDNVGNTINNSIWKKLEAFGGTETRPRNVAVYWYIKVK